MIVKTFSRRRQACKFIEFIGFKPVPFNLALQHLQPIPAVLTAGRASRHSKMLRRRSRQAQPDLQNNFWGWPFPHPGKSASLAVPKGARCG